MSGVHRCNHRAATPLLILCCQAINPWAKKPSVHTGIRRTPQTKMITVLFYLLRLSLSLSIHSTHIYTVYIHAYIHTLNIYKYTHTSVTLGTNVRILKTEEKRGTDVDECNWVFSTFTEIHCTTNNKDILGYTVCVIIGGDSWPWVLRSLKWLWTPAGSPSFK